MGQRFSHADYKLLKHQPERIAGLDLETINNYVYSFMITDNEDYTNLHKTMQTFASMSAERLILTAKRQSISLTPMIESERSNRVNLLLLISRYCKLEPEYYVRWPLDMKKVICTYITNNPHRDMKEIFDFASFTHAGVLNICGSISFDKERIGRPEDKLLTYLSPQIESMFDYLLANNQRLGAVVVYRMIEAFYRSSSRVIPTLGGGRIVITEKDYPVVPKIPASSQSIIDEYMAEKNRLDGEDD
jgi:hypothetical protein